MGETIKLKSADGFSFSAYVAGPANASKGVVVVQEIFGVNHHIRDMADRFAVLGYAVIAPAVYDRVQPDFEVGYTQDDIAKGRDVRMKLSDADLMKDIEAAAGHLGGKKLGIVGYCSVAPWRGGVLRAAPSFRPHRAGMAAAFPAPRTSARIARCKCISARRTRRFR
jgi:dienelactone hydrolase